MQRCLGSKLKTLGAHHHLHAGPRQDGAHSRVVLHVLAVVLPPKVRGQGGAVQAQLQGPWAAGDLQPPVLIKA